ncbi:MULTISPECIES: hypothetical protein [Streptomyces]|uniref:Uncharacterized protein n=1 Tax=Streptomyces venezuelae TaxID=54571 RepID=A0A5P2B5K2_STRVZ|nr:MULTISPECIES: hypothetical protein [Streptomyces]NDZ98532.1 hypothetical protein [Streptomyces sp. SID10116]MYY79742.1 hypothetical protein [Streptomyces sp. SID335]MYZ16554.1 hypothetical protein [Streptomyces sp. SID337]NDZ84521.1 hypothetical protein [Streptomyces sp. SID10115]NEB43484.1 hypothetical protein [Streptomyces sp. SID339]
MSDLLSVAPAPTPPPLSVEEQLVADWMAARADDDQDRMRSLRKFARAIDPDLLAELDGFNTPAVA